MTGHRRTLSIHARLFLGFACALAACAALMVAIIYVGMRFLPTYGFSDTVLVDPSEVTDVAPGRRLPASGQHPDITTKEDVWNTVLAVSAGGVLVVGALGLGAGWFVSKRLLAPLGTINEAARKAADGNLGERIAATGPPDELHRLADTFDEMLARLEKSFTAHQRFAANASHELLTPLATTRAALQVTGEHPSREELAELLPMLRETNERGIRIVHALLDLASAESAAFDPEPVDLSALLGAAVAERAAQASSYGIEVSTAIEPGRTVPGNAVLLRQLALNLLDNALTHNEPGGSVRVRLTRTTLTDHTDVAVLEVSNTGPHVTETQLARLFEPFYRAEERVASARKGHGLGLAIVRSVTAAHHGTLHATANPAGGLTIRVELPR
ncbi:HAMP domain-containing histidine kinase [Streptomyces sp. YC504]|uniref:histidine kinase n=1 Tax=Streptomyces mesophilus TaxID=1775132 RepID=A0A6G4XJL1_9ACTN|nr:HAMP domain-containing sensor histidine kinase [Streptomyces mesophilus]NGO77413.1 HAMP domain-containing histidine kinase [Streptomyces mesophilus]